MMKSERMSVVSIIVPKKYGKVVIEKLHEMKIYHVQDHKKDKLDIGSPLPNAEDIAGALVKARSLKTVLGVLPTEKQEILSEKKLIEQVNKINESFVRIQEKEQKNKELLSVVEEKEKYHQILEKLGVPLNIVQQEASSLCRFFGVTNTSVKEDFEKTKVMYSLYETKQDKKSMVLIFASVKDKELIQKMLQKYQFQEMHFPKELGIKKNEKEALLKEQKIIEKEKEVWKKEHGSFLNYALSLLEEIHEKAEVPLRFGASEYTLFLKGWVPTRNLKKVSDALEKATKGNIAIEAEEAKGKDIPILLHNKKVWKPFEFFLELFSLPNYKEIDPSILMFFTFPLFFAIMLGDVGYGIVTLLLFLFLKKKMPYAKSLLTIMTYASLVTILFGFMYGEYFGYEHLSEKTGHALCKNTGVCLPRVMELGNEHGEEAALAVEYIYDFPRLLNRAHSHMDVFGMNLLSVLVIGAIIGFIHINFGIALGFYNVFQTHGFKHALYEKVSWWILQLGIILMALGFMKIGFQPWVGASLMVVAAVMLYLGEGISGLVEIPGILSNMLSYMRLGAVGLASVGLAIVINENLVAPIMEQGGLYILVGIVIFTVGHVINIALGIIGPFLHSLRLHYVEFFTKFYKGGGIAFQPFGKKV